MPTVNTLFYTSAVTDWLAKSHHPKILNIFDRACNLINEHRDVLSVVTPEIGQGPFNLVIDRHIPFRDHINLQSPVACDPPILQVGNLVLQTQPANLWNACPDWGTLHANRNSIGQQTMVLPGIKSAVSNLQFSNSLASSLAIADLSSAGQAANQLAGLGQGLTPSGDDYIMGALYATWIIHSQEVAERLAHEIVNITAPRTTSLSGAWLKAAGKGEAGILWHAFLESLLYGEQSGVKNNVSNILSVGATSGADALAGFINTFISYAELERKHVVPKIL